MTKKNVSKIYKIQNYCKKKQKKDSQLVSINSPYNIQKYKNTYKCSFFLLKKKTKLTIIKIPI